MHASPHSFRRCPVVHGRCDAARGARVCCLTIPICSCARHSVLRCDSPCPPPDETIALRRIIHVDMDAFYASVEQRDDPSLRGLPVAVGGSRERGVVAAASYEARRFGVHSAMASVTARRKCPELVFVRPRFDAYRAVSHQIHDIFARYTPVIQPLSLDEAYLDVTSPLLDRGSATAIAKEIKIAIRAETGLTASAGVSYNKFLAKLASDHRKPDGLFVITPAMGPAFVETLPVGKFHGVGPVTAARMNALGIHTGLDLRQRSRAFLIEHFGKAGDFYHGIARAEDDRPVNPDRTPQIDRCRDDVRARSDAVGRGRAGAGAGLRETLAGVCEGGAWRTHGDGEDKIRRLSADHAQPVAGRADRVARRAGTGQLRSAASAVSASAGRAIAGCDRGYFRLGAATGWPAVAAGTVPAMTAGRSAAGSSTVATWPAGRAGALS